MSQENTDAEARPSKPMILGEKIKSVVDAKGITVTQFAKGIGVMRPNAYRVFSATSLETYQLMRISIYLEYDFFAYLSELYKIKSKEE